MKITSAEFVTSATKPSQYPTLALPEIAFAGLPAAPGSLIFLISTSGLVLSTFRDMDTPKYPSPLKRPGVP
jgi:hypothetical protein